MRSRLRLLVGVVLVAAIGGGIWLLWRVAAARRAGERAAAAVDVLPDVSQRIQNFHRVKIQDGRKVWEVQARDAQYKEGEGVVSVIEPVVALYLADGREVSLRGTSGVVLLEGRELKRVDVEATAGDVHRASYEVATDLVVAPVGEVERHYRLDDADDALAFLVLRVPRLHLPHLAPILELDAVEVLDAL